MEPTLPMMSFDEPPYLPLVSLKACDLIGQRLGSETDEVNLEDLYRYIEVRVEHLPLKQRMPSAGIDMKDGLIAAGVKEERADYIFEVFTEFEKRFGKFERYPVDLSVLMENLIVKGEVGMNSRGTVCVEKGKGKVWSRRDSGKVHISRSNSSTGPRARFVLNLQPI